MLQGEMAAVRPRVRRSDGRVELLEDVIGEALQAPAPAHFVLHGTFGSGVTTALAHLGARFPDAPGLTVAPGWRDDGPGPPPGHVTVSVRRLPRSPIDRGDWLALLPWDTDDCIEYLLARHPTACASVMARLNAAPDAALLQGLPLLTADVLDAMAGDEALASARAALRTAVAGLVAAPDAFADVRERCARRLLWDQPRATAVRTWPRRLRRLSAQWVVQVLMAADQLVVDLLRERPRLVWLRRPVPEGVLREAGAALRNQRAARHGLRDALRRGPRSWTPAAASLLVASGDPWVPEPADRLRLTGAYLHRASWPAAQLAHVQLDGADLRAANLRGASLESAQLNSANLSGATLEHAALAGASLIRADLRGANLRYSRAQHATFTGASLAGADCRAGCFPGAKLGQVDLTDTRFDRADLSGADFCQSRLAGTSFVGADLRGARLWGCDLRTCDLDGVQLPEADLRGTNWCDAHAPGARMPGADLSGADLTGAALPHARLSGATLISAHLADIDLSGADLRDANFAHAAFHMGSSRSGLIHSTIASEGTRTGFYTEDVRETAFLFPEQIRKANLTGANLLGARIEHCDFYLVDLRGATYSDSQARHFTRCGAILGALV